MGEDKLQKKNPEGLKEKTQYALAFGVIGTMLYVAGFPMFIVIFFGIFAYFLWKTFASPSPNGTREVFEFYLSANEILRDDDRRWFGFEVQETIARGERILQMMNGAPPLVYFTLGALYHKIGDHKSAVNHLAYILENENADENTYLYASPELKNYVRILRKIEREPAEAPQTSAAVRALERARRNRGKVLLEASRNLVKEQSLKKPDAVSSGEKKNALTEGELHQSQNGARKVPASITEDIPEIKEIEPVQALPNKKEITPNGEPQNSNGAAKKPRNKREISVHRPPISEVLRDIYDEK